jgi:hypothetical protein
MMAYWTPVMRRQQGPRLARENPAPKAVRGPGDQHGCNNNDEEHEVVSAVRVQRGGGVDEGGFDEETTYQPLHVDSYAVHDPAPPPTSDEEIRRQVLASTPRAEPVAAEEAKTRPNRSGAWLWMFAAIAVIAVVTVAVAVPLATRSQQRAQQNAGDDVVAFNKYLEWQGSGGIAIAIHAETRKNRVAVDGGAVTSGAVEMINCRPIACLESDESCVRGELYSPGCCTGADCPNRTKCGEDCPTSPESCYLTDPSNKTCVRSECYTCNQYEVFLYPERPRL